MGGRSEVRNCGRISVSPVGAQYRRERHFGFEHAWPRNRFLSWRFRYCKGEMVDRAVALNPNSFRAWEERGWAYITAGQPDEAIRSFERRIRLNPFDPLLFATFAGMSVAFIGLGRFDEAVSAAKKAVRQNPLFPFTYRCLASALAHLGREAEAREAVAGLLELEPDFRISEWVARGGVSRAQIYIDGLRKAGLPE